VSTVSGIYSLAPRWMDVFEKWNNLKRFQKENIIDDMKLKGPVTEAHSWKMEYYDRESENFCPECSWFQWSYSYVITGDLSIDREIVDLKGSQFVSHWDLRHNGHVKSKSGPRKLRGHSHLPSPS